MCLVFFSIGLIAEILEKKFFSQMQLRSFTAW